MQVVTHEFAVRKKEMTVSGVSPKVERDLRQTLEGMPLVFDATSAGELKASIQFKVGGREPGNYYLEIESGYCTFHKGFAAAPLLLTPLRKSATNQFRSDIRPRCLVPRALHC